MSHIPKSYHFEDLKPARGEFNPEISEVRLHWEIGHYRVLTCGQELVFRDLVECDQTIYMVGRSCREFRYISDPYPYKYEYWLVERDRLLALIDAKYHGSVERQKAYSIPDKLEGNFMLKESELRMTDQDIEDALSQLDDDATPCEISRHIADWATRVAVGRMVIWLENMKIGD